MVEECTSWPKERLLSKISSDYGRSHYFFINQQIQEVEQIHKYAFNRSTEKPTEEERKDFFKSYEMVGEDIPGGFDSITPLRSTLLTRLKYEMLSSYLHKNGKTENHRSLALWGMFLSTQEYLYWIKYCSTKCIQLHFPKLKISWCFFQSSVYLENNEAFLRITMINYKPKKGAWQAKLAIPNDNKRIATSVFLFNLDKTPTTDFGSITVTIGGRHKKYKKKISKSYKQKYWGIYDADQQTLIKYCDTMPTW
eukprot:TRINITY_DN12504_c0_g1_i3.p1 TRINITY_DN12504_c0_g1~~TRINITY_DN12504_c0_g1_i3.p1  ORF type:complete len:252 (+),score=40.56 TRINITY_DN12504_c0_g1_i3:121-876(+)